MLMAAAPKTCAECSAPLSAVNRTGYCRRHNGPRVMQSPAARAKLARSRRLMFLANPEKREAQVSRMKEAQRSPEARAARSADMLGNKRWVAGNAAMPAGSEPRMRAGAKARAAKARKVGVPPEMVEAYYHLTRKKRVPQAEAVAMVQAQHEAEMQRWRRSIGAPA